MWRETLGAGGGGGGGAQALQRPVVEARDVDDAEQQAAGAHAGHGEGGARIAAAQQHGAHHQPLVGGLRLREGVSP
jgi:hypothetical protein